MLLQMAIISFFFSSWINTPVCVSMCMCVCHIFFIHSSIDGHLDCYYVLTIVNSAALNIGVHVSFWII